MADNTEESKPEENAQTTETPSMSGDQSFAYWITMLPFLAIAAAFVFEFSKTPGEYNKLINAAGAVVVGIFIASLVNAMTQGSDNKSSDNSGGPAEAPKA